MAERDYILELNDTELEQERRINSESQTQPPPPLTLIHSRNPAGILLIRSTFSAIILIRSLLIQSDIILEHNSLSQKIRDEANIKFKSEGNRIQFNFNEEILNGVQKLYKHLLTSDSSTAKVAADLIGKLKDRISLSELLIRLLWAGRPSASTRPTI